MAEVDRRVSGRSNTFDVNEHNHVMKYITHVGFDPLPTPLARKSLISIFTSHF